MRLVWDLGENALKSIATAEKEVKAAISDLHLNISCHDAYGKGFIKSCKVSPDAYIQMALQLAFYRDQRRFGLTYESSMTRLFRGGRTETIRSCSLASTEFVLAMDNPKSTHNDRQGLLEAAARTHSESSKRAMIGQGFDRHLFALYVVSRGIGREAKVLSKALSMPWDLSTSQLPQRQTPPGTWPAYTDNDLKYLSPSGGFGPVSDTGYGVSYMVAGEGAIFFHVTSKHSCDKTDSDTFAKAIHTALKDMKSLFE